MPFAAIAKAHIGGDSDGFCKVLRHAESGELLGVHMVGPKVTDLIAEDICDAEEIIEWNHFTNPNGYPIYKLDFETHLGEINAWLKSRNQLISTGRQGAFTYPGMHNAMRMGHDAATTLLT